MDIPLTATQKCWEMINKLGLEKYVLKYNENENIFKSSLDILNTKCWIPDVLTDKAPIYAYESETLCVCQYQQTCQLLTEARGCCKYCYQYLSKIDKQNYINISMDNEKKAHMHQIQHIYILNKINKKLIKIHRSTI